MMNIDLSGKLAVVTGGSRGIGKAVVFKLAEAGCNVLFVNRSAEAAKQAISEANPGDGATIHSLQGDIADKQVCQDVLAKAVELHGKIDILVNNAGITKDNLFVRMKEEDWAEVLATNLTSAFNLTQGAAKLMMKARSGSIVNIGSVVGHTGNAGQVNYSSTKSALIGMTKSIAKELAPRNILCNLVSPGFIDTDMTGGLNEKQVEAIMQSIPLKRYGRPEDVANAVLFLCSPLSSYITGSVIHVNGGML